MGAPRSGIFLSCAELRFSCFDLFLKKYFYDLWNEVARTRCSGFWRDQGRAMDPSVVEFVLGRWQCVSLSHEPHFLAVLSRQSLLVVVVL